MGLLIVDETKCKQDGFCVKDCPRAIIRIKDKESYPELVPGGEQSCLTCGHCVAVCPHGAMSHTKVPIEDCSPIQKELVINEPQVVQFLRSRRSIRQFKDKPVEKQKIQRLIEIARYAPTASNTQLVEWLVFADRDTVKEFAKLAADWAREGAWDGAWESGAGGWAAASGAEEEREVANCWQESSVSKRTRAHNCPRRRSRRHSRARIEPRCVRPWRAALPIQSLRSIAVGVWISNSSAAVS